MPMRILELIFEDDGGIIAYHGTLSGELGPFHSGTHFGTSSAANARIQDVLNMPDMSRGYGQPKTGLEQPAIYLVKLYPKKSLELSDWGDWNNKDVGRELLTKQIISPEQYKEMQTGNFDAVEWLEELGYDSIKYKNYHESGGDYSWMVLDTSIIKPYFAR
jgi:hypothetical protein